jgi:hypothetical protein
VYDYVLRWIPSNFTSTWMPLLHVCKRWRRIILASPQHLHLLLSCDNKRPAKKSLDIWPALLFKLDYCRSWDMDVRQDVITALKHHDRIAEITFDKVPSSVFEKISAFMQEPLPVVKRLKIEGNIDFTHPEKTVLVFPKNLPLDFRIAHSWLHIPGITHTSHIRPSSCQP